MKNFISKYCLKKQMRVHIKEYLDYDKYLYFSKIVLSTYFFIENFNLYLVIILKESNKMTILV